MNQSLLIGRYDDAEIEVIDTSHALAAHLCLFAILIRILFSPALLGTLGIAYEGDTGGSFISKIHPSSYLIILSFLLLIVRNENPVRNIIEIMQQNKILSGVIVVYALLTAYWAARNPSGVGIMLETHMMAPICALVLSYAPRSLCRRALYMFVAVTVINSSIGVGESIFKQRIFPYDDTVVFVKEEIFRSSALLGHPLNNAMFTSVMLPLAMILPMPKLLKGSVLLVILASLVAFGGRAGLIFSVLGLLPVGINHLRQTMINKKTTLLQLIITLATVIL